MKDSIIAALLLFYSTCMGQTFENPFFFKSDTPVFQVTKVETTKDTTFVFCSYIATSGSWANISKETHLRDSKSQKTFRLQRCAGLPFNPARRFFSENEVCNLLFCFPPIDNLEQFDFIENEDKEAFNVYGINLKKKIKTSYTDVELKNLLDNLSNCVATTIEEKEALYKDDITSLNNLASYYANSGNNEEAIRLGMVVMEIRRSIYGNEHPCYMASLNDLASYHSDLGNFTEAIRLETEVREITKKVYGTTHPEYVKSLEILAYYNKELGNYAEAIQIQKEIVEIKKETFGIENIEYARSLKNYAFLCSKIGNYKEALQLQIEASEIDQRILGTENYDYATSLRSLACYYSEAGNYNEAIQIETKALEIYKKIFGTEHPDYAISLSNIASFNSELGNYAESIRLQTESMEIQKRILGLEHPDYAISLSFLAQYYSNTGNYNEALRLESEAIKIYPKDHPYYARSLNQLSRLNYELGKYTEAIGLGTEVKELYKNTLGTENPYYTSSLSDLALYNSKLGNFSEAINLGTEALIIQKRILGTAHKDYATSLNNLALYNEGLGNYTESIRLGIEAMETYKNILGTKHPDYATSISNLALYNERLGNYAESIKLETEAMEIRKKALGTEHPDYAASLNSLAQYNWNYGNKSKAIELGTEVVRIRKRCFGESHPLYATSLSNLAVYNSVLGNYNEVKKIQTEAMEILKNVYGTEHPFYASSLSNLASCNSELGNYTDAIIMEKEAMDIRKESLGTEHPAYANSCKKLAIKYLEQGHYQEAYDFLSIYLYKSKDYILKNFTELSSHTRKTMWMNTYAYGFNTLLPFLVFKNQTKQSISELYNKTCLFSKSILLNADLEIRKLIFESEDPIVINKYNALSTNINIYNKLIEKPIKERLINADSLNNIIERQEMELARVSKAYGNYTHNLTISWKEIQEKMEQNDIAIEFLDFPIYGTDSILYVALTLKKDYENPHIIQLFEKQQLENLSEMDYYSNNCAYSLIWKPIEHELTDVKDIYFAPSGELHRIGIEHLPISKTENIRDRFILHRLSSTRQLALNQDETKGERNILYGGIDYDVKHKKTMVNTAQKSTITRGNSIIYNAKIDSLALRASYEYLNGTKIETEQIAKYMDNHKISYLYYSGIDGSEESFKKLNRTRPRLIHIATHGFYIPKEDAAESNSPMQLIRTEDYNSQIDNRFTEDRPMTRSGLLFSGCNHAINHEIIPDSIEDGILTAEEISALDLRGLDLVVLSACQSGLGDIISGEGVFGLQRGFKKAGAKTIIMSLWKVNDNATMKMMVSFYRHYLDGMSKEEAFFAAQEELRKDNTSQQERPDWAAFVMLDGLN